MRWPGKNVLDMYPQHLLIWKYDVVIKNEQFDLKLFAQPELSPSFLENVIRACPNLVIAYLFLKEGLSMDSVR